MRRAVAAQVLVGGLILTLSACAPMATVTPVKAWAAPYNGPIQTVAVVMSNPRFAYQPLARSAYNLAYAAFVDHPYTQERFDIVERSRINAIMREYRLGADGILDPSTAPRLGRLLGARDILVLGLTSANIRRSSVGGLDVDGVRLGGGAADVSVTISARLVDVQTGRVLAAGIGSVSAPVLTGVGIDGANFSNQADAQIVLDLVPEATTKALNIVFKRIG